MQDMSIAYSGNIMTSNNYDQPPRVLSSSRAPESQIMADNTFGMHFGPKSLYQIPWPRPVFTTVKPPNNDLTHIDPGRTHLAYTDEDPEVKFVNNVVPTFHGIPLFDPYDVKYKFKRPYSKVR